MKLKQLLTQCEVRTLNISTELEITRRKLNDLEKNHEQLLPRLERLGNLLQEKDLTIQELQSSNTSLLTENKNISGQLHEAKMSFCEPSDGEFSPVRNRRSRNPRHHPTPVAHKPLHASHEQPTSSTATIDKRYRSSPAQLPLELSSDIHTQPGVPENGEQTTSSRSQRNIDVFIIGTSNVRRIDAQRLYPSLKFHVETLRKRTIHGATDYVKNCKLRPRTLILHVSGNSLVNYDVSQCVAQMSNILQLCGTKFPHTKILVSGSFPRKLGSAAVNERYRHKVNIFNDSIQRLVGEDAFISHPQLQNLDHDSAWCDDEVHLSNVGVKILVTNLKRRLNPLLIQGSSRSHRLYTPRNKPRAWNNPRPQPQYRTPPQPIQRIHTAYERPHPTPYLTTQPIDILPRYNMQHHPSYQPPKQPVYRTPYHPPPYPNPSPRYRHDHEFSRWSVRYCQFACQPAQDLSQTSVNMTSICCATDVCYTTSE